MLTQERIMFHYSLLGDSNVEGSFYFFGGERGLNINVDINKKERWILLFIIYLLRFTH